MNLTEEQLRQIKNYFATQKDVVAVYLYGSFAEGTTHQGSDIDLGVLFDPPIRTYFRLGELINGLSDLDLPAEPDIRDISLKISPVYLLNVIQGQLVYAKNEEDRINFEVAVMRQFYDTQQLRDVRLGYMRNRLQEGTYGF